MHPTPSYSTTSVCEATISTLPATGGTTPAWLFIVGILTLLAGITLVVLAARRARFRSRSSSRGGLPAALAITALLAGGLILAPHTTTPAHAAPGQVAYTPGCTLIHIDQIALADAAAEMLPGDTVTALTATITNRYSAPIRVEGTPQLGTGGLPTTALTIDTLFTGQTGPVTLAPGASTAVTVTITLPPTTDNSMQGATAPLSLTITASEQ